MPLHLEEFQRDSLQGYVEEVEPAREYRLARFMPNDETFDMEFTYNVISGGYGQMASITALDSGAPLRDKDVLARMTGELAKVQHGYKLTEKELLMYNRPRTGTNEAERVVKVVYDQTDKLVFGVQDREEWFRSRAIYHGELAYTADDVVLNIDFGIPEENKLTATYAEADFSFLEKIQAGLAQFEEANNGASPEAIHMSPAMESRILQSGEIKSQVWGSVTDARIVKPDQLQALFQSLAFPAYEIVKDRFRGDNGVEAIMPDNRLVFIGEDLGNVLYGPTVENDYNPGVYVVPVIQETNPPKQEIYVGASMFPALKRPSAIVHVSFS